MYHSMKLVTQDPPKCPPLRKRNRALSKLGKPTQGPKGKPKREPSCLSKAASVGTYRKILLTSLYENCQKYSFYPAVRDFVENSKWDQLYQWTENVNLTEVSTAAEHFAVSQMVALIKKAPFHWSTLGLPMSPEDQAKETFYAAEEACRQTNLKLRSRAFGPYTFKIGYMRRWISHVLGETPDVKAILDSADYSSGAALGVHGNATNLYRKLFAESWTVTPCAMPYAQAFFRRNINLALHLYDERNGYTCFDLDVLSSKVCKKARMVTYNKLSFVPKTVKTHRVIAVEPLLNSVLQKGVDSVMRQKLLRAGYNLRDQGKNQDLAKIGSESGVLATMDLKSASDTVAIELARILLPRDWFDLLNRLRSPSYELDGSQRSYQKFCSMGNGFCFPLETLFFSAACRAILHEQAETDTRHAVYGDDIVIPATCYEGVRDLLTFLGFTINDKKSFSSGPFRESCGADWYLGQDVRPVYLDYSLDQDVARRIFHNATLRGSRTAMWFETIRPFLRKQTHSKQRFLRPFDRRKAEKLAKEWLAYDEKFVTIANLNGAFDVELDTFMASRWARWNRDEQRWSWTEALYSSYLDSAADPMFLRAQYLAFLRGSPEGRLALRRKTRMSIVYK